MSTEAYAHRFIFSFILVTALGLYFIFQIMLYNMKKKINIPAEDDGLETT